MKSVELFNTLFDEISKLPVIDTHEHLQWNEQNRIDSNGDVLGEYLSHYLSSDIISSGLKRDEYNKVIDPQRDIVERWRMVEPYWEKCRYTGYGRALDIAVKNIYNIDGVNAGTIERLNNAFLENKKPGHYKRVLRQLCNIQLSLLDVWTYNIEGENELFKRVWQPMNFIMAFGPDGKDIITYIEEKYSITVRNIDDWLEVMEKELDFTIKLHDSRILKCAIAYARTLRFEKVEYDNAKNLFDKALKKWENEDRAAGIPLQFPQELQDFMMHSVLKLANARNLTVQFHTGLLEGNGNTLSNSDPSLLTNLFLEYPDVDFDLFHIGYPYQGVACALSKMFPNVYIDMCWAHIISPSACVSALDDFLDAIPYNKISGFGGDYLFVDGVYGHLHMSRQNISRTLSGKVEQGVFGEEKALDIAKALYFDNPKRIFKL